LSAKLAELPGEMASASSRGTIPREAQSPNALEGVTVRDIDRTARQQFNIPSDVEGALVQRVQPGSPAQEAGLRAGDVIVEINKKAVNDADGAARLLKQSTNGQTLLRVWSRAGGLASTRYVVVETPKT
jgi:serine protease Do